jgi:YfiH family protein
MQSGEVWIESLAEPESSERGGVLWRGTLAGARWLMQGRGAPPRGEDRASSALAPAVAMSWVRQIHSDRVLEARVAGSAGDGDGLIVTSPGLAATVAAADCVPVLLAGSGVVAAVHAGWRGLAQGIVRAAAGRFPVSAAWIGPAIGPCCYEVGGEVAAAVVAASGDAVLRPGGRGRPHLDLALAAARQLVAAGVEEIHVLRHCTRCRPEWLESHRRDGAAAGRNLASIWLAPA